MDTTEIVRSLARTQHRLAADDQTLSLDSMSVIEFTLALEEAASVEIPNVELGWENFTSVDAVVRLIDRLRAT